MRVCLALLVFVALSLLELVESNVQSDGACRVLSLLPFSDNSVFTSREQNRSTTLKPTYGPMSRWTPQRIGMTGYSYMASVLLAVDHFNNRDASVVPEIASIPTDCTVNLTSHIVDGALSNVRTGELIYEEAVTNSKPCAVLGPYGVLPATWSAPLTTSMDVPQVFYSPAGPFVTEQDEFPTTVRATVTTQDHVSNILSLMRHLGRTHLGVIHGGSEYDRLFATFLLQYGPLFGVEVKLFSLTPPTPGTDPKAHGRKVHGDVKASGIRTLIRVFLDMGPGALMSLADGAASNGLLDDGYLWILEDNMAPVDDIAEIVGAQNSGSPLDRLLSGAIVVSPTEPWEQGVESAFVKSWKAQSSSFVDRVNGLFPLKPDQPEYVQAPMDYFQTQNPRRGSSFVYDSVMAIGMGACKATGLSNEIDALFTNETKPLEEMSVMNETDHVMHSNDATTVNATTKSSDGTPVLRRLFRGLQQHQSGDSPPGEALPGGGPEGGNGPPPPPAKGVLPHDNPHVQGIIQSVFTGASGRVAFGELGPRYKDRDARDVTYGAFNIQPVAQPDGTHRYQVVLVSTSSKAAPWSSIPGKTFVYRDGTSELKGPSQAIAEWNYISNTVRALGLTLMAVAWATAIFMSIVVWKWQDKPLVRAGQPVFLHILCIGSFLTSSTILTLSFDENSGWGDSQLDAACTLTPWLFFCGMNSMFAGLFCKLWRVEQVTQLRRRQVKAIQSSWPLVILLVSTAICLLVWTVFDPWQWNRRMLTDYPPVSYGQCTSEYFGWFFSVLSAIMIIATSMAFAMAWKTKDLNIDSRFDDANAVFLAIGSQLQAWFAFALMAETLVGLPILAVLKDSSVDGTYLGRILLIWLFSMATILIVIAPKIWRTWRSRKDPSSTARTSRVFVSGLTTTDDGSTIQSKVFTKASDVSASFTAAIANSAVRKGDDAEQPLPSDVKRPASGPIPVNP